MSKNHLLIIVLFVAGIVNANNAKAWVDTFEDTSTNLPSGWTEYNTLGQVTQANGKLKFDFSSDFPSAQRVFPSASSNCWISFEFSSTRNYSQTQFHVLSSSDEYLASVVLGNNATKNIQYAMSLADGKPAAYSGSFLDETFAVGVIYQLSINLDFETQTVNFYQGGVLKAADIPFLTAGVDVAKLDIQQLGMYNDEGRYFFDNIGLGYENPAQAAYVMSVDRVTDHLSGITILTTDELSSEAATFPNYIQALSNDETSIQMAFDLVKDYETAHGGLFTKGSTTEGGFSRTGSGYELENMMLAIQQAIIDFVYNRENLAAYPSSFENVKFETASFFPGAVDGPSDPNIEYTVHVNGTHIPVWGSQPNYYTEDARRPTGCYLAPGSVAKVSVPASLVGVGASVLVGAHTWDLSKKTTIKRVDRISKRYELNDTSISIANPMGGGIYINIPYERDLGLLDITLENVVRSPFYSRTVANVTSLAEWKNTERTHPGPWADFETEKFMMQVPSAWIYNMDDPETLMNEWDQSMDAVSELHGRPLIRSKTILYSQMDVIMRGVANFPGYPQSNHPYNPLSTHTAGNFTTHPFIQGPRYNKGNLNIVFHELGHAEKMPKFPGELETYINFLWVAVQNKKFGVSLDQGFKESFSPTFNMTVNHAAISWMIAENFRNNTPMSDKAGGKEGAYQHRGYAKYAEIVRLFGWEVLEDFYTTVSEDAENGITYPINSDPVDNRILRISTSAGVDLRPLIHFWGVHPLSADALGDAILADTSIHPSVEIYDQLQYYKSIVPMSNAAFQTFGSKHFSKSKINSYSGTNIWSYTEGFYNHWWNDYGVAEANAAIAEVDLILNLYFPDGRPGGSSALLPENGVSGVSVYPTVFNDCINIEVDGLSDVCVYNQLGALVWEEEVCCHKRISTQAFGAGLYLMNVFSSEGNAVFKLLKD